MEKLPPYSLRVNPRARRVILKIRPGGELEVVIPRGFDPRRVPSFVEARAAWIHSTMERLCPKESARPEAIDLAALGQHFTVSYQPRAAARLELSQSPSGSLQICGPTEDLAACQKLLQLWLKRKAEAALTGWLGRLSAQTGLHAGKIQVRTQRSRWGSCSSRGTISLNAKLLFLRAALVEYILIHELCHTREANHSPRFWALVARHLPDYAALEAELKNAQRLVPLWAE